MNKLKKITAFVLLITLFFSFPKLTKAEAYLDLNARAAILVEETTGKVLYGKNEKTRMYPASMTKIMTALLALDYLDANELVTIGSEINNAPAGSSLAGHKNGESILAINLIRGLIIPSGNETALVVAKAVVRKARNVTDINNLEAEKIFAEMMNEKAKSIGANDTHFTNPHGFHDDNHYSTAYDMALISIEAMKQPLIRQIVSEKTFEGNGAGENPSPDIFTQQYKWATHNELLVASSEYSYQYASGIKTGRTVEASDCVTASAEKDGKKLISVVMYSPDPGRWTDSIKLFQYGFDYFNYETVQAKDVVIETVPLYNFMLGESDKLDVLTNDEFVMFLSKDELNRITHTVEYNEELVAKQTEDESNELRLLAPITKGDVVGKVTYKLDDEVLFTGDILAAEDVIERTFKSDTSYYFEQFKKTVFSIKAIPYWVGAVAVIVLIVFVIASINNRRSRRYRRYSRW